jgi:hypothetical protein
MNSVEAQEFMDKITIAAQRFGTELAAGASVGEALELALEIPGLADTLHQMESAFGNIAIVLLEVAATIGESFGMDVAGLREDITRFATGQFVFDIQTAETADELESRMTSAINRGVSESDLADLTGQAIQERLEMGDIEGAQALVDAIAQIPDMSQVISQLSTETQQVVKNLGVEGAQTALQPGLDLGLVQGEEREVRERDLALLSDVPLFDPSELQSQVNDYVTTMHQELQTAVNEGDFDLAQSIGGQLGIQNIEQFISEQQSQQMIDTLFPKPTDWDVGGWTSGMYGRLANAIKDEDWETGASIAERLMDIDDPNTEALINDFATTLIIRFNNALGEGDTEEATNIMAILGLSPEENQLALDSMVQRLSDFSNEAGNELGDVESEVVDFGNTMETVMGQGSMRVDGLYAAITSEQGELGLDRLKKLSDYFDNVTSSIREALSAINDAEKEAGDFKGHRVGGVGHAGVSMVGEGGRELIFSDENYAVLNNQTTERLFTALSGMGGATSNHYGQNRIVNYSPTIVVQNDAQAAMVGGHSLDQLRGLAF